MFYVVVLMLLLLLLLLLMLLLLFQIFLWFLLLLVLLLLFPPIFTIHYSLQLFTCQTESIHSSYKHNIFSLRYFSPRSLLSLLCQIFFYDFFFCILSVFVVLWRRVSSEDVKIYYFFHFQFNTPQRVSLRNYFLLMLNLVACNWLCLSFIHCCGIQNCCCC